nr:hypothetical protein [uncultured Pedobacter sp.]
MNKVKCLKEIQDRLPDDLLIEDETSFEFTEDEFIGILSWIKYFNIHYKENQKSHIPQILFPIVSKRLRLDFGLYNTKDNSGKYVIYISVNGQMLNGKIKKESIKGLINTWGL